MIKQKELKEIHKTINDNNATFTQFFQQYHLRLLKLIIHYIHNNQAAEDVLQDVFLRAYQGLDNFRGDSEMYTWLYRIATNVSMNYLKNHRHDNAQVELNENTELLMNNDDTITPENIASDEELKQLILSLIKEMPADLRDTLMLREIDGLSYAEIAKKEAIPLGTVRSRIFRAREVLSHKLKPLL